MDTGGITFTLFPLVSRADVVDVVAQAIRPLGEPRLGWKIDAPGEPFLWMQPGEVVRFDPELETFAASKGPDVELEQRWSVRIDERTVLLGGMDGNNEAHFVKMGLRPEP